VIKLQYETVQILTNIAAVFSPITNELFAATSQPFGKRQSEPLLK
jgi:hypothetical protein